jgi:glycine/D-amino acid oxidase-like deaminating enzyme
MPYVDTLIVGQGIAGSLLSLELLKQGEEVLIADDARSVVCSRVAAGLFHPIVPRTGGLTWKATEIFGQIQPFWNQVEESIGQALLHCMPMYYQAADVQAVQHWRMASETLGQVWLEWQEVPFPSAFTQQAGRVDIRLLCETLAARYALEGRLVTEPFQWTDVRRDGEFWSWKQYRFKRIVLCQGHRAAADGPFQFLPFQLTKGELLTVRSLHQPEPQAIHKKKAFVIPLGNDLYRIGSSYTRFYENDLPEEKRKEQLLAQAREVHPWLEDAVLVDHEAGVRPTTGGRRPFMGEHPLYPGVFVCNGWGSKGAALSAILIPAMRAILAGKPNPYPETDILQYWNG